MLKKISHYRIVEKLGAGGMGAVYRAQDTRLRRSVALKVLPAEQSADPRRLERFQREAEAVARLNHPNIVAIYSIDEAEGVRFITMELVTGQELSRLIPKNGMTAREVFDLGLELASALAAAHELGVVHRDLKPSNIMLSEKGRVKVLDFGLAKLLIERPDTDLSQLPTPEVTGSGLIVGTVPYMSPEQVRGLPIDHRSDIFSLGVVLYEATTGRRPFRGDSQAEVTSALLRDQPRSITELRPDLPAQLAQIIARCLEKAPHRRYQSAIDVRDEIEGLRSEMRTGFVGGGRAMASAVPTAVAHRVLVIPFKNRTQDPGFDSVGLMAADWLTQGLSRTGRLEVVPTSMIVTPSSSKEGDPRALDHSDGIQALAGETGAGTVVSGGYYRSQDRLLMQCQITDTLNGTLVAAVDPVKAQLDDPLAAIEILRQRVIAEIAAHLDAQLAPMGHLVSQPPSYRAYELYVNGMECFFKLDFRAATKAFKQAAAVDADYHLPLLMAAACHWNLSEFAEADAIVTELEPSRNRLAPLDRYTLDFVKAEIQGNYRDALGVARKATELAPQSFWPYNLAIDALKCNRPLEARAVLSTLDPERGFWKQWGPYWTFLTTAYHLLGDFEGELREARRSRRLHSESMMSLGNEVRALAALGRTDELGVLLDESTTMAIEFLETPATVMALAARELQAHGWTEASHRVAERALAWLEAQGNASSPSDRESLARALVQAEQFERAREACEALAEEFPDAIDYRGLLGVLAARGGDRAGTREAVSWLREQVRPFIFGRTTYWQAAIAAWAGEKDRAMDRLREAIRRGRPFEWPEVHPHADPMLAPLANHPAFLELIEGRG
jgi:tetratricopeptide (TPR) repeat protein/predicted Ser/Thr protein kinase